MDNEPSSPEPDVAPAAPAPAAAPATRRKRPWFLIVLVLVLALGLFMSVMMNFGLAMSMMGSGMSVKKGGAADQFPKYNEKESWGSGPNKVIRMGLNGAIFRGGEPTLFGAGEDKVESLLKQIRCATNDKTVKAIILEVNSPGGAVTPSDEIYMALERFKKSDSARKVIVHMRDLAASGGYYVAAGAHHIMAEPTTIVGSIGVIMQSINMKGLADKVGVKDVTIKSGANKDLLNPFQEADPEDIALLQGMVDSMMERFFNLVQKGRGIDPEELKKIADGRVFTAQEAMDYGLVDELGYWEDVVVATEKLLKGGVTIYRYKGEPTFLDVLYGVKAPQKGISLMDLQSPRLLYLWKP